VLHSILLPLAIAHVCPLSRYFSDCDVYYCRDFQSVVHRPHWIVGRLLTDQRASQGNIFELTHYRDVTCLFTFSVDKKAVIPPVCMGNKLNFHSGSLPLFQLKTSIWVLIFYWHGPPFQLGHDLVVHGMKKIENHWCNVQRSRCLYNAVVAKASAVLHSLAVWKIDISCCSIYVRCVLHLVGYLACWACKQC